MSTTNTCPTRACRRWRMFPNWSASPTRCTTGAAPSIFRVRCRAADHAHRDEGRSRARPAEPTQQSIEEIESELANIDLKRLRQPNRDLLLRKNLVPPAQKPSDHVQRISAIT